MATAKVDNNTMAAAEVETMPPTSEPQAPVFPDYMTDPNAVLKDINAEWRYGRPPDYSNTRRVWGQTKRMNHEPGSLPELVENLVKNWEIEASFKLKLSDWRTVDPNSYSFAINGGPPQTGEHMLKVGTYNAVIVAPNQWYSPRHSDFASSHKTFKRMMPTFAWEVLEVYSGPPVVAFRWRHWGTMKDDYVGWNDDGEKVMAKAHGGTIDIQGVTVAHLNDKLQVTKLETWFDPVDMFRQISPEGVIKKEVVAAAAAAGCPVMAAQAAKQDAVKAEAKTPVVEKHDTPEKHRVEVQVSSVDPAPMIGDAEVLEKARVAEKAVVDDDARLEGNMTATRANPAHGEIPKANAE